MASDAPPLRVFDGWLKQMSLNDLSDVAVRAFQLIFSGFAEQTGTMKKSSGEALAFRANKRRYAGDFTLGRARYYTVAKGSGGDDAGGLIAELGAYADPACSGCELHDHVSEEWAKQNGIEFQKCAFLITLAGTAGSNALIARLRTNAIWAPYRIIQAQIPDVLDLRYPDAQDWLWRKFRDLNKHVAEELNVDVSAFNLDAKTPSSFFDMLCVLMDPENGGNGVTDQIGQVLRAMGVSALIYPAARIPAAVVWRDGAIQNFQGWNLVDYRGDEEQCFEGLTLEIGTDPWVSPARDYFSFRTLDQNGSWLMAPPKRQAEVETAIVKDDDLITRYAAARGVFSGLIDLAARIQMEEESRWLDALSQASELPRGKEILRYMGIQNVRHAAAAAQDWCLLFECAAYAIGEYRVSRGYASLFLPPLKTYANLDREPDDYVPGTAALRPIEEGLQLYYLRERQA